MTISERYRVQTSRVSIDRSPIHMRKCVRKQNSSLWVCAFPTAIIPPLHLHIEYEPKVPHYLGSLNCVFFHLQLHLTEFPTSREEHYLNFLLSCSESFLLQLGGHSRWRGGSKLRHNAVPSWILATTTTTISSVCVLWWSCWHWEYAIGWRRRVYWWLRRKLR